MSKWSAYYRILDVSPEATKITDSQSIDGAGVYGNHSWFQRLVQGSASRLTRYREYSLMDNDVAISRALDTIAEEIVGNDIGSQEPLVVEIDAGREEEIESNTVFTLKAALKYWCDIHKFSTTLFKIARVLVKYGDCFFEKNIEKHEAQWNYVNPYHVLGAIVDKDDVTKILGWQIKTGAKTAKDAFSEPLGTSSGMIETETKAESEIVRFTMSDFLSESAPFGESILAPVYRAHKQKELIEDAIIIYRIQRAPERRVFYIDVGNMPASRTKTYLENVKNEIKQKKVPSIHGGQQDVDTVYNPQSMCLALDTKIPLLDGRTLTLQEMINEYNKGKQNWVYSVDPKTGKFAPGCVSWAGVTRKNTETIKLTLDNGDFFTCTPDHKIPVQGKGLIEAQNLTEDDSLFPLNTKNTSINEKTATSYTTKYEQIYDTSTKSWKYTHRVVANYMKEAGNHNEMVFNERLATDDKNTIHHIDHNAKNNNPDNLTWMNASDHTGYHTSKENQKTVYNNKPFNRLNQLFEEDIKVSRDTILTKINNDIAEYNHRVVNIENDTIQDTGTLTIDGDEKYHNYHTFGICGNKNSLKLIYVTNSEDFFFASRADGRGSKVETLPGGQNLGDLADLEYFQREVWRGLRIPTSYMTDGSEGASYNDGKVGIAYIQELRFSLYIKRLQGYVESVLDKQFKQYLRKSNIYIDSLIYKVKLPEPSNFGTYRQQEVDASLLSAYSSAEGIEYLSPRFKLSRYLQLTDEEIILNERLRREELGLDPDGTNKDDLKVLYGGAGAEGEPGGLGGDVGGLPGGDVTADTLTDDEVAETEPGEETVEPSTGV